MGDYARDKVLQVSVSKTETLVFRPPGRPRSQHVFRYMGMAVPASQRFKSLGFVINDSLTSRDHLTHMETKTSRAVNSALMTIRRMGMTRLKDVQLIFGALIESQLYGAQFLNHPKELRRVQQLQQRFFRVCYSLPSQVPDALVRLCFFRRYPDKFVSRSMSAGTSLMGIPTLTQH